jgi:hypothetical protein
LIVDNSFLSTEESDYIQNLFLGVPKSGMPPMPWVFAPSSNLETEGGRATTDSNVYEHPMFVAPLDPGHPYRNEVIRIFEKFLAKHQISYTSILRIKANWVPAAPLTSKGRYQMPHIDDDREHKVFLYYVNDADGDTIMFNELYQGFGPEEFTIRDRITPQKGKAIVFNGDNFHAPSAPIMTPYRCVINIDFA